MPGIGSLNEKPLHASLKEWYAQPGDVCESTVDGYVIDVVHGDLLLEIQTGNFASLKKKLNRLVQSYHVRLIYPVAREKWIVKPGNSGSGGTTRRKSPKRGRPENVFREMVSVPHLIANPNFSLEVLMTREEEVRSYDGKRAWRRKGWVIEERRLLEVVDRKLFEYPEDWLSLIPRGLESFTAKDLSEATGISRQLAYKMTYCLRNAGVIKPIGKQGRANQYLVAGD